MDQDEGLTKMDCEEGVELGQCWGRRPGPSSEPLLVDIAAPSFNSSCLLTTIQGTAEDNTWSYLARKGPSVEISIFFRSIQLRGGSAQLPTGPFSVGGGANASTHRVGESSEGAPEAHLSEVL